MPDKLPDMPTATEELPEAPGMVEADKPVTLDATGTGAFHFARHGLAGLGDKAIAAWQALRDVHADKTGKATFSDAYDRDLAFNDKLIEDSDQAHPTARWVGNGLGTVANAAMLGGLGRAAGAGAKGSEGLSMLARAAQGAKTGAKLGAALGAVGGYGTDRSDSLLGTAGSMLAGAGGGALGGGALGAAGGAISAKLAARGAPRVAREVASEPEYSPAIVRMVGGAKPTPQAQALQRAGVRSMTFAQQNPETELGAIEEFGLRDPTLKNKILAQRGLAEQEAREAALRTAMIGEGPLPGVPREGYSVPSTVDRLGALKKSLQDNYDQIVDQPVPIAATHPKTGELVNPTTAFKAILEDPEYQADPAEKAKVFAVMKNQLGLLYEQTKDGGPINGRLLQGMRSALRTAAQNARLSQDGFVRAGMLQDAADAIGGGLKAGLTKEAQGALAKNDAAWSNLIRMSDASERALTSVHTGDWTPKQLLSEVVRPYGRAAAQNSTLGGPLRELAEASNYSFTPRAPMTGHGEMMGGLPMRAIARALYGANASPETQSALVKAAQSAQGVPNTKMLAPIAGSMESALRSAYETPQQGAWSGVLGGEAGSGALMVPAAMISALRGKKKRHDGGNSNED